MPPKTLTGAEKKALQQRLLETCRGPVVTPAMKEEMKQKQLESLKKKLEDTFGCFATHFSDASGKVEEKVLQPRTNFKRERQDSDNEVSAPTRTPSDVGDAAVHKYALKQYTDKGMTPHWTNIAAHFGLASGQAAHRMYDSFEEKKIVDPCPSVKNHILNIKYKNIFWEEGQKKRGGVQLQNTVPEWKVVINLLRLDQAKETRPNTVLDDLPKLDDRTYNKLIDWACPEARHTTKVLTAGRIQGQDEPRNAITCAACVMAEIPGTAPEVIFSHDMFTIMVDNTSGKVSVVRLPAGALKELAAGNLTPGVESHGGPVLGKCSIPAFGSFDATGEVLSLIQLNVDRNVPHPDPGQSYCIYPLEAKGSHKNPVHNSTVFAAVLPYGFSEDALMQQIWSTIVLPKSDERCYQLLRLQLGGTLQPISAPESTPSASPVSEEPWWCNFF